MISGIIPRPIAFVSTINSETQKGNLAPFSYFNAVSSSPPCISISVIKKPNGDKKDTLKNIEQNGQFVVNSAHEWMVEPLNQCSGEYEYGVDELQKVGLTAVPSVFVKPPRVLESAFQMECELYKSVEIGEGASSCTLLIGRILMFHISEAVYDKERKIMQSHLMKPVTRLGGIQYGVLGSVFEIPRPKL